MSKPPDFRDLVGEDLSPEERARLERVHDMLITAGPPPELPPELQMVPSERSAVEPTGLPRRRVGAALALAAAIALLAFLGGYIAGHSGAGESFQSVQNVTLGNSEASAVVRFGPMDANGNTTMDVKVKGLRRATRGRLLRPLHDEARQAGRGVWDVQHPPRGADLAALYGRLRPG